MHLRDSFYFGKILKTYGKNAELLLSADVDDLSNYTKIPFVLVDFNSSLLPLPIEYSKIKSLPNQLIIKPKSAQSEEDLKNIIGKDCYLPLSQLPEKKGDKHFYYHDIIDYEVIDQIEGSVGKVKDVYSSGPQDILMIQNGFKEILIPMVDHFIKKADKTNKKLYIEAPEGLIQLYLNDSKNTSDEFDL